MDKKFKFTNANIKSLPNPIKRIFYYDTVESGLSFQVMPSGANAYYLRFRNSNPCKVGGAVIYEC